MALGIIDDLLLEGGANFYLTPSNLSWLTDEHLPALAEIGFGRDAIEGFRALVATARQEIPYYMNELERHLLSLSSAAVTEESIAYARGLKSLGQGLPRPVEHFVGEAMVSTIHAALGDAVVQQAIKRVDRSLPAYQEAAAKTGAPSFDDSTLDRLSSLY